MKTYLGSHLEPQKFIALLENSLKEQDKNQHNLNPKVSNYSVYPYFVQIVTYYLNDLFNVMDIYCLQDLNTILAKLPKYVLIKNGNSRYCHITENTSKHFDIKSIYVHNIFSHWHLNCKKLRYYIIFYHLYLTYLNINLGISYYGSFKLNILCPV